MRDSIRLWGQKLIESNPWFLAPISWIYAALVFIRNQLYDWKLLSITRVPCTVVSVGNIVAGGTGKTPFIIKLASSFPHRKVAILSRGYGTSDEPMMMAKRLPSVKVFVGKNRAKLAAEVAKNFDLILLDDGFQHRKLFRDFDIVLTRPEKHYLPWGFLRDSPRRLRQADAVFSNLKLKPLRILDLQGREISSIAGWEVVLFCGIAKPDRFKKTVEEMGAKIVAQKIFADHAQIDLDKLPKGDAYICTEKDAVKIPPTNLPIVYLEMEMQVSQSELYEKLVEKIDQKIDNRPRL
ncbi:MAG: tetraacyldisaccharide 4'-kinase [Parachlamydiales bacterium]|nr:tetraacyldisaccharide 4'-kinase [Parachlamydiales bacterium]